MSLPNRIFYVEVVPGGTPLGFREKGGGVYVQEQYARAQKTRIEARGSIVTLWVLHPGSEWAVVPDQT